jgi:DNA-directed RNA polymerase specialized sigma24 family protein
MHQMFSSLASRQADLQVAIAAITQGADPTATEISLSKRARAGERQALSDLLILLQPRMIWHALSCLSTYGHALPSLDAEDLIQEAMLVMSKRMEEARTKEDPLSYLVAAGTHAMDCLCIHTLREPQTLSLDAPRFQDDETPWHEAVPSSVLPTAPYAHEEGKAYTPLYQAIAQLPDEQRTVIEHYYGLHEHAPSNRGEIRDTLGWTKSRTTYQRKKTLAALALALKDCYPQYVGQQPLVAHIPESHRQRLNQAYADLHTEGLVSVKRLTRTAKVEAWMATAYLRELGTPCLTSHQLSRQHLDQTYADLCARSQTITAKTLAQQARANVQRARTYLKEKEAHA